MSKWISFHELIKRLDIAEFEIFEYLKKGLKPYSKDSGRLLDCPPFCHAGHINENIIKAGSEVLDRSEGRDLNVYEKISVALEERAENELADIKKDDPAYSSWKWLEVSDDDSKKLLSYLDKAIFRTDDVLEFEKESDVFPCKPGTKWSDIKITLIDKNVVIIETPQGKGRFSYHELGMSDERTRDKSPSGIWELLKLFAKCQGFISPTNYNSEYFKNLSTTAKRLNKDLKDLFRINESIYTSHYKKIKRRYSNREEYLDLDTKTELSMKGYETKILFSDKTIAL